MKIQNQLYRKTILWNGDSICAGSSLTGNWASRIAERNEMTYKSYAVGGGTVAEGLPPMKSGKPRHSVSYTLDLMHEEHPDADYVILEGGTNDADLLGTAVLQDSVTRLGRFDPSDYGGSYDRNTFCGALESVFYRAKTYWRGKKLGFIVAQKMGAHSGVSFENRRFYFDRAVELCEKWDIPCLNLWNGCPLDPRIPSMYDATKTADENRAENVCFYSDGQHLTARGYDVTADLIEAWLKTL